VLSIRIVLKMPAQAKPSRASQRQVSTSWSNNPHGINVPQL
jgi:hypothetical protein